MTETRRPVHLGFILGLSAGVYAASLAGVTALQSQHEAEASAAIEPTVRALDAVAAGHDSLATTVESAGARYASAATGYRDLTARTAALERGLGRLASTVGAVEGTSIGLPSRVQLPVVSPITVTRVVAAPAPATHATTGASGKP